MQKVALEYGSEPGWVVLRELCGHDEESVERTDSEAAIALLDRLLVDAPGAACGPGRAAELTVPDRDRLLAVVFQRVIGRRVDSTARCRFCDKTFDLDFLLDDLLTSLREAESPELVREPGGVFRLGDGRRFRLPRGIDERAVADQPPAQAELALLQRCMIEGSAADDPATITDAMPAAGPLLDVEISARCAECARHQPVRFDLQNYLFTRMLDERRTRALEVHRIASTYRWSLRDILDLRRSQRRLYVELIDREKPGP
jgi:hypothetical protein